MTDAIVRGVLEGLVAGCVSGCIMTPMIMFLPGVLIRRQERRRERCARGL